MRGTTLSIGGPDGSQGPASNTLFGWRRLRQYSGHREAEVRVGEALIDEFGLYVEAAGARNQSHDLEVIGFSRKLPRHERLLLDAGLYEVKSLWRKNEQSAFDRRFKIGTRGESIYGRRDSAIKAFALGVERRLNLAMETQGDSLDRKLVSATRDFIEDATARRHSKRFQERVTTLARTCLRLPELAAQAQAVLSESITDREIVTGFSDINGIFIVAGSLYTLVTKAEMGRFIAFDSASSEGPKLRMLGVIPSETTRRKEKGKTK